MIEEPFLRATRESYDVLSATHLDRVLTDLGTRAVDRALLSVFAEWVRESGNRTVADVGCGAGRLTAALHRQGLDAFGVDLSPEMIRLARQAYPELRFEVGSMLGLDVPDASLGGVLAHYSIIHVPWEHRPQALAGFHRVLAPGGQLMLAFQIGDDRTHRDEVDGVRISLDWYRQQPDEVAELLDRAGFEVRLRTVREPETMETRQQGYLIARKPAA